MNRTLFIDAEDHRLLRRITAAAAGATLLYLPPYSPDFNPIERWFAKLKGLLRTARRRTVEELWATVADCLAAFSPTECRNYFRHCGYAATTRSWKTA